MRYGETLSEIRQHGWPDWQPVSSEALAPVNRYGYLFGAEARRPENRLPDGRPTRDGLIALGSAMGETGAVRDSAIPAAYTFLGQFIDHDLSLEDGSEGVGIGAVEQALPPETVVTLLKNVRTGTLDLDSVYGSASGDEIPKDPADTRRLLLGQVTPKGLRPIGTGTNPDNDVPRYGPNPPERHRFGEARIGDLRNDENVIISQLQVAFLKFHNAVVTLDGGSFEDARRTVRQHYQWVVLRDFLTRICEGSTLAQVIAQGPTLFPTKSDFIPLEFTVGAYRFGHSMVRQKHNANTTFPEADLAALFQFVVSKNGIGGDTPTMRHDWIVEWNGLLSEPARALDTTLAPELLTLPGMPAPLNNLAVRNLLRGFLLALPTGQAVAAALGVPSIPPGNLLANAGTVQERSALERHGFHERTPLWYYLLAEASIRTDGQTLGPIASRIVANTFIRSLRASADSILAVNNWLPSLPSAAPGTFTLADLLRIAGP